MWNAPTGKELGELPNLYETQTIPLGQEIIYMHFFHGGCDWYAAEFDGADTFFGYVVLHGDTDNAEWGYFCLSELLSINVNGMEIDRDLHWEPTRIADIPGIGERYEA